MHWVTTERREGELLFIIVSVSLVLAVGKRLLPGSTRLHRANRDWRATSQQNFMGPPWAPTGISDQFTKSGAVLGKPVGPADVTTTRYVTGEAA